MRFPWRDITRDCNHLEGTSSPKEVIGTAKLNRTDRFHKKGLHIVNSVIFSGNSIVNEIPGSDRIARQPLISGAVDQCVYLSS